MDKSGAELIEIVYASAATVPFSPEDLTELLEKAREKNEAVDVSGVLLFHDGSFLQVLEGPEDAVQEIFERVDQDERHDEVIILRRGPIETRSFGEWTMGFVNVTQELEGFTDFLRTGVHMPATETADAAMQVLGQFRSGRWRRSIQ